MNLISLLRHISLKRFRLQKAQFLIAVAGICLAVAAMVSVDTVTNSVIHSSRNSIDRVAGRADLQLTGAQAGFPGSMIGLVQKVPGVEYAVPVIQTDAHLIGGKGLVLDILGVNPLEDSHIRDYSITVDNADTSDPLSLLQKPDSILLPRTMAEREGIRAGQRIKLQTVEGIRAFTVGGLLNPSGPAGAANGDIAVMDIVSAARAFGMAGRIDRIDVRLLPGEKLGAMKERIERALPAGYSVEAPGVRAGALASLIGSYSNALGSISLMAIFLGMYLIYMTVSISAVQRKKEIGIMRALGARRGDIIRLFLAETFLAAILGSALGIGFGLVLARITVGAYASSVTGMFVRASAGGLIFSWETVLRDSAIGIFASLLAAVLPVLSSVRITPASAMRSNPFSEDQIPAGTKLKAASALCLILSASIFAAIMSVGLSLMTGFFASFTATIFLLLGVSFFTPFYLKNFTSFFHRLLCPHLGIEGKLAGLNLRKGLFRNAVAVAAIFASTCLLVGAVNDTNSLRKAMHNWCNRTIHADLAVTSGSPFVSGGTSFVPMPGGTSKCIEKIPGVCSVDPYYKTELIYHGAKVFLGVGNAAENMRYGWPMIEEGSRKDVARLLPDRDNVVVNETFALKYHLKPGDSLLLPTPEGRVRFGVAAVATSYLSNFGVIMIDINTYRRYWNNDLVDAYFLHLRPGADISNVRKAIFEKIGKNRKLFVLTGSQFKGELTTFVDNAFVLIDAVNMIALIIAGLGIVITLFASVLERTREIGVLRSIGMKRAQITAVVTIESALIGAAGGLLGSLGGIFGGWMSTEGYFRLELGKLPYQVDYRSMVWVFLLTVGLSALAGFYPAMRAAKTNIVEALNYE